MTKPTLRLVSSRSEVSASRSPEKSGAGDDMRSSESGTRDSPAALRNVRPLRTETFGKVKSHVVGVIVNNAIDPFFDTLLESLEDSLERTGRSVLLCDTNESFQRQARFISQMEEFEADGVIVSPAIGSTAEQFLAPCPPRLPVVFVSRTLSESAFDYVRNDDCEAGRLAASHLLRLGHRRIAFVGGDPRVSCFADRLRGHQAALRRESIPFDGSLIRSSTPELREGYRAARWISRLTPRPTAAVCYNGSIALGLCYGLPQEGLNPGRNFALVGHEDITEASLTNPPMTVTSVSRGEMGRRAARVLIERIENPDRPPQKIVLKTGLIVRGTCGVG